MSEMVERLAKVIDDVEASPLQTLQKRRAVAVLLAMRIPTREMVNAAWIDGENSPVGTLVIESSTCHARDGVPIHIDTAYEVWQAMIDKALKD